MNKLAHIFREIYCLLSSRSRRRSIGDDFLQYLKEEEEAATASAERIRNRRRGIQDSWRREGNDE